MTEDMKTLIEGINTTWQAIAYDIPADSVPAVDMIELSIDANRLLTFAGQEYENVKDRMIKEYDSITKFYEAIAAELPYGEYETGGAQA